MLHRRLSPRFCFISVKKDVLLLTPNFQKHRGVLPPLEEREIALYEQHFALLKEWNEKIALVSRKSIEFSFGNHYADSIHISDFARKHWKGGPAHDLGSGAGFPGMLFAIRYPEIPVILYERIQKKRKFLETVQESLQLPNLSITGELLKQDLEGLILARAVMPKEELFPFMEKRMKKGAVLIVNSGGQSEEYYPLKGLRRLAESEYTLPLDCGTRRIEAYSLVPRGT